MYEESFLYCETTQAQFAYARFATQVARVHGACPAPLTSSAAEEGFAAFCPDAAQSVIWGCAPAGLERPVARRGQETCK